MEHMDVRERRLYVCPLEDQGPLALRASMRSRAPWRFLYRYLSRSLLRSRGPWYFLYLYLSRSFCALADPGRLALRLYKEGIGISPASGKATDQYCTAPHKPFTLLDSCFLCCKKTANGRRKLQRYPGKISSK